MINIDFSKISSISSTVYTTAVGVVISYPSDPTEVLTLSYSEFLSQFPLYSNLAINQSYLTALSCYQQGLSTLKVVSIGDKVFSTSTTEVLSAYKSLLSSGTSVLLITSFSLDLAKAVSNLISTNYPALVVYSPSMQFSLDSTNLQSLSTALQDSTFIVPVIGSTKLSIDSNSYTVSVAPSWIKSLFQANAKVNLLQVPSLNYGIQSFVPTYFIDFTTAQQLASLGLVSITQTSKGFLFYGIQTPNQSEPFCYISAIRLLSVLVSEVINSIKSHREHLNSLSTLSQFENSLNSILYYHLSHSELLEPSTVSIETLPDLYQINLSLSIPKLLQTVNIQFSV